jgi:hypothetical protein
MQTMQAMHAMNSQQDFTTPALPALFTFFALSAFFALPAFFDQAPGIFFSISSMCSRNFMVFCL